MTAFDAQPLVESVLRGLRDRFSAADYTVDGVARLLGPVAHEALGRNQTVPGAAATGDGSPLATLTRLWPLQRYVPETDAERALGPGLDPLCAAGVLSRSGGEVRALLDLRPYADDRNDWWLLSDLTTGMDGTTVRVGEDHVLGVSGASTSLAALTVRRPADSALDLGTGCGVQSLHLSAHCRRVVGTDVNRRALAMAGVNAALNEVRVDLRDGSLFAPVPGETFDLIVSNPPFVISPGGPGLAYRDSGWPGDEVMRRVLTGAPRHLAPGGWCQVLGNWPHPVDGSWQDRVTDWVGDSGCDAWVLQREVVDPAQYVEMWLADEGLRGTADYLPRYDAWLRWFADRRIEAIGFGWACLRRTERTDPQLRVEDFPYEVEQPLGPAVADWARRVDWLAQRPEDADLLPERLRIAPGVVQESSGEPGAADPATIVLRARHGVRRARRVDTVEAGLVGACDGDLTVDQILTALATLLERESGLLRRDYLPRVRSMVSDGLLVPDEW